MAEMDTGWSLSSGRLKVGPVGQCDGAVLSAAISFIQPHRRQILVEVVTGADLPSFDV